MIENQLKKMFKFVFYTIVWKTKLSGVGFVRLDSGREPDLSGSESDMYTVQLGVRFVRASTSHSPEGRYMTLPNHNIETRTSGSFKVSNWDILEHWSQKFEIRFSKCLDYGNLNPKKQNFVMILNFDLGLPCRTSPTW